ncbi:hypothetical protein [Gemmobacter sp.]|nr:hypothetical protein [Gemmobacter sp.]
MGDRCLNDACLDNEEAVRRLVKAAQRALPHIGSPFVRDELVEEDKE